MSVIFLHYPTGGYGHYLHKLMCLCFSKIYLPKIQSADDLTYDKNGYNHNFPLHCEKWTSDGDIEFCDFQIKTYDSLIDFSKDTIICLVDSGLFLNDSTFIKSKYPQCKIIKMCIDDKAKSIIGERSRFDKESPESFLLDSAINFYRRSDANENWILNGFQPQDFCINIPISDMLLNVDNFVKILKKIDKNVVGDFDENVFNKIHNDFITINKKYTRVNEMIVEIEKCLNNKNNFVFEKNLRIHEKAFLVYWLEKKLNKMLTIHAIEKIKSMEFVDLHQLLNFMQQRTNSIRQKNYVSHE